MNANPDDENERWLLEKNRALWAALERKDMATAIDIAVMFEVMLADPAGDRASPSTAKAELFDSLAWFWKSAGQQVTGQSFEDRALALRRHLAEMQMEAAGVNVVIVDRDLSALLESPPEVPGPAFERSGLLLEVARQVVSAVWNRMGLPRQQLAMEVAVDQPWELVLHVTGLAFIFLNLDSPEKSSGGLPMQAQYCAVATLEGESGLRNKQAIVESQVMRVPAKSSETGKVEWVRIGWVLVRR